MKHQSLGGTGLFVSPLCLGTMTFGQANESSFMHEVGCDDATSFSIMNRALDAEINFFDTANVYGQDGLTERVIGRWFEKDGRRDDVVLATKGRFRMKPGPAGAGASRLHIMQAVEASLRRLKTDRIDLYQIHMQDNDTPEEETLRALDDLVQQGKILYIGCSNYAAYRLVESLFVSEQRGLHRYASLQAQYSLMERNIEREHVPSCQRHGLSVIPWSPLGGGFLSGKYMRDDSAPADSRFKKWGKDFIKYDSPKNWDILDVVRKVATSVEATPAQVSLAWLLTRPTVASVIFGARSLAQLEDNLKAATLELPAAALQALDEVSALSFGYPYDFIGRIQGRW